MLRTFSKLTRVQPGFAGPAVDIPAHLVLKEEKMMKAVDLVGTQPASVDSSKLPHSDALVFFGATGDLASKQIFPALQEMVRRDDLNVPIIGVAKSGWGLEQLRDRAKESVTQHGGIDEDAFAKMMKQLQYIDGDYQDPKTFERLLGGP